MPSFVDTLLERLFPKGKDSIAVSGPIRLDAALTEAYPTWREHSGRAILQAIRADISRQRVIDHSALNLLWYNDRAANGFSADLSSLLAPDTDVRLLGRLLTERITALGYRLYTAEHKTSETSEGLETRYWYYLKPIPDLDGEQALHDQKYGNVKVELFEREAGTELRFLCTVYAGRNYTPPLSFEALLQLVFDID